MCHTDSLGQTEIIRHLHIFLLYANWNNKIFFSTSSILLHHDWPVQVADHRLGIIDVQMQAVKCQCIHLTSES